MLRDNFFAAIDNHSFQFTLPIGAANDAYSFGSGSCGDKDPIV